MLCQKCNAEIPENVKFCPNCGQKVEELVIVKENTTREQLGPSNAESVISTEKEDDTKSSVSKFKLLTVIAMACFIFPFFTVSCSGENFTASGLEAMIGRSLSTDYDFSEISPNQYLVVPFILGGIGIALTKSSKSIKIPCVLSGISAIMLLFFRITVDSFYNLDEIMEYVSLDFRWGWWASFASFIGATWFSLHAFINEPPQDQTTYPVDQEPSQIVPDESDKIVEKIGAALKMIGYMIEGAVIITILAYCITNPPGEIEALPRASDQAKSNSDEIITLEELSNAYYSNAVAADNQYAGQRLNVRGEVTSITPNPFDDTVSVSLGYMNTDNFAIFLAYFEFDSSNERLGELSVGEVTTLSGYLKSENGSSAIHFSEATLYGQEYAPMTKAPDNNPESTVSAVSDFVGFWGDSVSQRCNMTIEAIDSYSCSIKINWGSSASEDTEWSMTGQYNPQTGFLEYADCMRYDNIWLEDGEPIESEVYWNGTGYFFLSDGYLYWQDDVEGIGENCRFEKFE